MAIELPDLPYDRTALEPHLSGVTVDLHRDAQRAHVEGLEGMVGDTPFAEMELEEIARKAQGSMAGCAAQAWAMALYWNGLKPAAAGGGGEPAGQLAEAPAAGCGSVGGLRERCAQAGAGGWGPAA